MHGTTGSHRLVGLPVIISRLIWITAMATHGPNGQIFSRPHVTQSSLKRSTCNLCRERKVRCDREKPQCQRCRKSGHECIYPSEGTDNDEIKSALNFLHSRLRKYHRTLRRSQPSFYHLSSAVVVWLYAHKFSTSGNETTGTGVRDHNSRLHEPEFHVTFQYDIQKLPACIRCSSSRRRNGLF